MKQKFLLPFLLCGLLMIVQSCTKESRNEVRISQPARVINASVSSSKPYTLNVTESGDVSISKQAKHFAVSQTETDANEGMLVYKYIPVNGYAGTDEVEIITTKSSTTTSNNGCNNGGGDHISTSSSSIVIKFTVAN